MGSEQTDCCACVRRKKSELFRNIGVACAWLHVNLIYGSVNCGFILLEGCLKQEKKCEV
jgi:hypothetical protein